MDEHQLAGPGRVLAAVQPVAHGGFRLVVLAMKKKKFTPADVAEAVEVTFDAIGCEMLVKVANVKCSHEQRRDGLKAILEMVEMDIEAIEQNDL